MKSLYFEPPPHLVFKWRFDHLAGCGCSSRPYLKRDDIMPLLSEHHDSGELSDRLRDVHTVTAKLIAEIIDETCRRFPSVGQTEKTARIERLIESEAWTDAALALIDLELPQWQVRRIAYDEGEWYCALSRERELPDWLDRSIETRHTDLALAILSAFVDAQRINAPSSRTSVPIVPRDANPLYEPVSCDNFG